ncbi:MAG: MBL fold metallo-hydrolase [Clostridiales bacterium]|jgi:beta-lactamase-like protein|nr:MBL fold metallo-hydrolase [Clostridiales bacterium]
MISFKRFTEGILGSNTYLVWDSESKEAALIDAGNRPGPITELLEEQKLTVKYIILTHAHFDHIYYLPEYRKTFSSAQTVIHEEDNALLANPRLNASTLFGSARVFEKADLTVREGDTLLLGKETLKILSTPGHTPGSICILAGTLLFSGDTLFYSGFGRTDLGAGSVKALSASIERLYTLQEDIEVYPGHGTKTSIGREKACNPFLDF